MSAASLSGNFFKRATAELVDVRDKITEVLNFRALQTSLFDPPVAPAATPAAVAPDPVASCVPDVLSPSSVNAFNQCEVRWYYRKVLQLPETRGAALGLGSAVHAALAANFRQKIETHEDLPYDGLRLVYLDEFAREFDTVTLTPEDDPNDLVECGETMLRVYMEQAAPRIEPAAVELPVAGVIGGVPVRGVVDLLDVDGNIVDMKTAAKKPSGFPADYRLQVSTYSMLTPKASGVARLDTLTKTKTVGLHSQTIAVSDGDRKLTERLYSITADQMRSGLVRPNRASHLCSRKYCAFADQCVADYGGEVD